MGRIVIWIVGLALLSIIYVAAVHFEADEIESDLKDRSIIALVKNNISWADVVIYGRDAIISGIAPDLKSIEKTKNTIMAVWGIRVVECRCKISNKISNKNSHEPSQIGEQKISTSDSQRQPVITTVPGTEPRSAMNMNINKNKSMETKISEKQATNDDVAQCQDNIDDLLREHTIEFDSGSSTISSESIPLLDKIIVLIQNCHDQRIKIAGHTDNRGNTEKNITLSLARAEAVVDYFKNKGISLDRLNAVGYGDSSPVDTNDTGEGRKHNRRIEFHITP